jgi:hypothetical protein
LIERRYTAGLRNLQDVYLDAASEVIILDGASDAPNPYDCIIATKQSGYLHVIQPEKWSLLCRPHV